MNDACGERRIALGAYAIGALETAERDQVEDHLAQCAGCRDELTALVALTPVLGRLSPEEAAAARPPLAPGSRGSLVERTLAELARHRRSSRRRWRVAMAGGVAAVAALGVAVAVLVVTRPAVAPVAVAAARLSGSDATTGVSASAELYVESWGTWIHLDVSGVEPGDQCELVAVGRDGSEQVAGTWRVGYTGGVDLNGSTGIGASQITSLKVVTTSGSDLVDLQA
jgi:anti-sigma factor ChrR (cupin superfamily)